MKNENGRTLIRNVDLHSVTKEQSQAKFHYSMITMGDLHILTVLTLRLLMYIYGAPSKARNANIVYIWTYVWQR